VIDLIHQLNDDKNCLGFIIQLPLPDHLQKYKAQLLSLVAPDKDID
jgi:5,10-methylene-tetrahydrofolate dehydrogenase/methenyl tetrahydrofolate cyclohydrolase